MKLAPLVIAFAAAAGAIALMATSPSHASHTVNSTHAQERAG